MSLHSNQSMIDNAQHVCKTLFRDDVEIIDIMNDEKNHACVVVCYNDIEYMLTIIDVDDHSD